MADEAAGLQVFLAVEAPALGLEVFLQLVEPLAPGIGAQHQEKVVATDMADEVAAGIDPLVQALRQAQQHLVAAGIAVQVGQRWGKDALSGYAKGLCGYAKRLYPIGLGSLEGRADPVVKDNRRQTKFFAHLW